MNPPTDEQLTKIGMSIDPHAVLYKGGNRIYRCIHSNFADFYAELLKRDFIQELMADGTLIRTTRSERTIPGHEVVLEHPLINFVSYPFEWTPAMFKRASETILKLNLKLLKHGFCTQDAHPWNILFDGTQPVFVDFTSIVKLPEHGRWLALDEFNDYCTNTLTLMAKGYTTPCRAMLRDIFSFPDTQLTSSVLLPARDYATAHGLKSDLKHLSVVLGLFAAKGVRRLKRAQQNSSDSQENKVQTLLNWVQQLDVTPHAAEWSGYYTGTNNQLPVYDGTKESLARAIELTPKHQVIQQLLKQIQPRTLLDMGCNRGIYSQMAALQGAQVVGIDMDEWALNQMYADSCRMGTSAIPLFVNAVAPAQATGFHELPFPTAPERLRSDCVLCLALVHHLVFKRTQMSFEHIVNLLSSYSKKHLIVEFIPREDEHVRTWQTDRHPWYTLDGFVTELKRCFPHVTTHESFPKPRVLIHCCKQRE